MHTWPESNGRQKSEMMMKERILRKKAQTRTSTPTWQRAMLLKSKPIPLHLKRLNLLRNKNNLFH